ncbi:MAG TPA: hypothetical protein VF104_04435 [Burkholderiales bacterium]
MRTSRSFAAMLGSTLMIAACGLAAAAGPEGPPQTDLTPPHLSFIEGQAVASAPWRADVPFRWTR